MDDKMYKPMPVVKSNRLIETSYRLGSREQFFILYLISQISQRDTDFHEYTMHYKDIAKLLNFDGRRRIANRNDVFKMMNNLNSEPIRFLDGDDDIQVVWITRLKFNRSSEEFSFTFSRELRGYLLQLKEHFTKYNVRNIVYLNSHSTRIYEILKRHQFKGHVVFSIEDLKFYLGIKDKYPEYYEFKRCVLLTAQKELEKYTDIRFTFIAHRKEGKRILSLRFDIFENTPRKTPKPLQLTSGIPLTKESGKTTAPKAKSEYAKKPSTNKESKVSSAHQRKLQDLSQWQRKAYEFLAEKSVNKAFIVDKVLAHEKLGYEPIRGFEDVYLKIVWQFFIKRTKAKEVAGAFVSWWKNGRLTEPNLHARNYEAMIALKFRMTDKERDARTAGQVDLYPIEDSPQQKAVREQLKKVTTGNEKPVQKNNKEPFDLEVFSLEYADEYEQITQEVVESFRDLFKQAGQTFDVNKHQQSIQRNVKSKCEQWYQSNV
ncbi:MAG: replication initiation protein [Saprospiraceae bacterium]